MNSDAGREQSQSGNTQDWKQGAFSIEDYYSSRGTTHLTEGHPTTRPQIPTFQFQTATHNDVEHPITNTPVKTGVTDDLDRDICASIPLFLRGGNKVKIPKKTERAVCRYVPKSSLRKIHPDTQVAIELCLMFLSNLSDTYYRMQGIGFEPDSYEQEGWKNLSTSILRKQFSDAPDTYRRIIDVLEAGTAKGPIIECDYWKIEGYKSYGYRLVEPYRCKGVVNYTLKTNYARNLNYQNYYDRIAQAMQNPIAKNLIQLYKSIELPTRNEIEVEATRLINAKYTTKRGKKLTRMGKKKKDYWKHPEQRSFVEQSIEIFDYLTEDGFMVPTETGDKSGGRVVDSFTLMPSWIRNLCRIDGEQIQEADYSALHPNIAMNLYGGRKEFLTHQRVAEESGTDVREVKLEHLSFFNKRWDDMQKSSLFGYYQNTEPALLENIRIEKQNSIYGHKSTSRAMFKKEVEVMTDVVRELNRMGIYVGYVYDALFCSPKQREIVRDVMNRIILKHGIKTVAK